ncbi:CsbD family protein [Lichenibacterium dinghuense]|uniref:CsbD family protein n=1 Tax=Lichenibacterium dinghuense TaxID=2895977 RepID=UPI001F4511A2|nr:CsbD family protein [Lichenibacterium sp. 6Y81]
MDTDRITGAAKELGGKVQGAVGSATGDKSTEAEGKARELGGNVQNAYGQAKDAVKDAASNAADAAKDAYNNAGSYGSKAQDAAKNASDTLKDAYNNPDRYVGGARDAVQNAAGAAQGYAQDVYNNSGDYYRQGVDTVTHKVEENPLVALLVAGAVGYGLALLIHGRG